MDSKKVMDNDSHLLLLNQLFSTFASTTGTFILSWMVYDLTGSKTAMGGLWLVNIFGQMIVQFLAGPVIDRWKRTTMMQLSEWIRFFSYSIVLLLFFLGETRVEILYAVSFLTSIVVYDSAANALIPKIVDKDKLVKVNARISGLVQLIRLVALPIAGIMISTWGQRASLMMIVALFFMSILMIRYINEPAINAGKKQTWSSQFKKGIHIYKQHTILLYLGLFITTTSFGVFATQAMYIPYVKEILGGSSFEFGLFSAAFPFGYIIGTYIVGKLNEPKKYLYHTMVAALFIGGLTYISLGFTTNLGVALLIETLAGITMPFWNVYSTTLYQRLVPESLLGQVFSVRFLLTKIVTPLGILYGTFCATVFSIPALFFSVGIIICLVSGIGLMFMSTFIAKSSMITIDR
ncbi:MFS transporter [Bacillus sp. V59.32b]|uniref:MFS transporter n=1 Tax=Bacillus sp. V59.32b TaxID=1758642 RepID=UPI000E3D194D|nr:MFS transporter [Bacillus sp. V59.32b]RFU69677.1 MFS transporter [Bacillus sp. V59.32b]